MGVATLPQEANMLGRSIVILCLTALFVQVSLGQCTFNDGSCMYDFSALTVAPENFYSASTNASSPTADVFAFNICGTVNTTCGGNDTSVCQTTNSGTPTSYIAGVLSAMQLSSLAGSQENCSGAILEYGDGTSCVSGPRVTYITLTCDEQQDTLAVTSVVEAASCAYYINATSKYACGTQVVVNQTSVTVSTSVSVSASASSSMTVLHLFLSLLQSLHLWVPLHQYPNQLAHLQVFLHLNQKAQLQLLNLMEDQSGIGGS